MEAAMKMLQPVDPGQGARKSDNVAYKLAWNKWERDPLQYSCKAYTTARQELNILLTLRHSNIVPLIGICTKPLALILQLAPLGALDLIIKEYRRSGAQINPHVIQKILLQVSKALEYLHQQHIIYRDLKSENVLVWKMYRPHEIIVPETEVNVEVKLADYGISRSTLPTGTKGFGGTEGFMAPEIMRFNGEEEYTEKVDCFSFGMFMYELISLRLPFEGQDCVKDHILDGGRPSLTPRDLKIPCHLMDLMVLCWYEAPKDRPTASQIVSIVSAPEFIHLFDAITLVGNQSILSAAMVDKNGHNKEIWISRLGSKTIDVLTVDGNKWIDYKTLKTDKITVTSMCMVPNGVIWMGDSQATIHVYSSESYQEMDSFRLDPNDNTPTTVKSILYLKAIDSVAVCTTSGRLWICDRRYLRRREIDNESCPFLSIVAIDLILEDRKPCIELWCGQAEGKITVIKTTGNETSRAKTTLDHYQETKTSVLELLDVFELISDDHNVWSFLYPGCIVYHWDVKTQKLIHRLDCSKLAPCSESLMSISIEEHLTPGKCQVTSMAVNHDELFIGTTWGCLIVVEAATMRPVTVFRPHEEEIKAIIPFELMPQVYDNQLIRNDTSVREEPSETSSEASDCDQNEKCKSRHIVTIGKGLRSLVSRYMNLDHHQRHKRRHNHSKEEYYPIVWKSKNWMT